MGGAVDERRGGKDDGRWGDRERERRNIWFLKRTARSAIKEKNPKGVSVKRSILFVFLSIIVIPSLTWSAPHDVVRKAIVHIATVQDENGSWSRLKGELPPEAEATAWAVKVLAMNRMAPERVDKGVAFLLKDQRSDGSWSNNTAATAFAILALKQTNKGDEAVKKAIAYLREVQDLAGGFKRIGKEGAPLTIYTAVVLAALREAEIPRDDPMVVMAIDWLTGCQNPDGGYGLPRGTPSMTLSTAWTVRALMAYGVEPTAPSVEKGIEWVLAAQRSTGGFSNVPSAPEDPEVTAYALMALGKVPEKRLFVMRGLGYLERVQQADGAFISSTPIPFNKMAKKNTQTTCFVAWALSEVK